MKKNEIWLTDLPASENCHVQHGYRPVLIVSNDIANRYSSVITVVPLTSRAKKPLSTHVYLCDHGLNNPSTALCEQIMTIDKSRCNRCIGFVQNVFERELLNHAVRVQLGMAA